MGHLLKYFAMVILCLSIFHICLNTESVAIGEIINDGELALEESLYKDPQNFHSPKSIVVVPIKAPVEDFPVGDVEWYQGIFYYQITRYGLPSMSYHYVITNKGDLIVPRKDIPDRVIPIKGGEDVQSPIVVGYMSDIGDLSFNELYQDQIAEALLWVSNINAIEPEKIKMKELNFKEGEEGNLEINFEESLISWKTDLEDLVNLISDEYNPKQKVYSIDLLSFDLPSDNVSPGDVVEVDVKIKNTGKDTIYGGASMAPILSKIDENSEASMFFVNDVWGSQTQWPIMRKDQILQPEKEISVVGKFSIPLRFENVSEKFEIVNQSGDRMFDRDIDIAFNVSRPDEDVIEILSTETGYLKVRGGPGLGFEEITRVSPGERFIVLDRRDGFVNIRILEDQVGWVSQRYVSNV